MASDLALPWLKLLAFKRLRAFDNKHRHSKLLMTRKQHASASPAHGAGKGHTRKSDIIEIIRNAIIDRN